MTLQGKIHNGMVVFNGDPNLPEGTPVTVMIDQPQSATAPQPDRMTEEKHRRLIEALDRIAAMPIEGAGEPFSGRDHDKVLYGKP